MCVMVCALVYKWGWSLLYWRTGACDGLCPGVQMGLESAVLADWCVCGLVLDVYGILLHIFSLTTCSLFYIMLCHISA